jgi:hypothetical protein
VGQAPRPARDPQVAPDPLLPPQTSPSLNPAAHVTFAPFPAP